MKLVIFSGLILFTLASGVAFDLSGQTVSSKPQNRQSVVTIVLNDVEQIDVLETLSEKAKVPLGFYPLRLKTGTRATKVSVRVVNGTISDVLNQFIKLDPRYKWKWFDGVINVFPKDLANLLETRLKNVDIRDQEFFDFGFNFVNLPEMAEDLRTIGLKPAPVVTYFGGSDQSRRVTLVLECTTFRDALNSILRSSQASFWTIDYTGREFEYIRVRLI